jgi:hypothetical protein
MSFKIKFIIVFFLLLTFDFLICNAQTAVARLEKTNIFIGDQIRLTLEFTGPADIIVNLPQFADTILSKVEIVDKGKINTTESTDKKSKTLLQVMTITSFDSGTFAIPPIRVYFKQGKDTSQHFVETQPLLLSVQPVKVDMQKGIRDIKPPLEARFTFREALPYIIGILLVLGITAFIIYYLKKKKKKEPIFRLPPKPKLPPHEIALAGLEELRNKKLWQNNKIKEFHTELTEIIRVYIEDRFGIPALEMISDEISSAINKVDTDDKTKSELKELLSLADLVKFAKENPLPSEHDRSFNNAIDFVKGTIIQLTTNNEKRTTNN